MITPGTASHNRNCGVSQKELRTASSHKRNCELRRLTKGSAALKCASHKTKCSTNCVSHKTIFSELAPHKKNCSKWRLYTKESARRTQRLTNELLSKGNHRIFENRIQEESKHLFIKMWHYGSTIIGRFGKLAASARNLASEILFQESGLGKWPPPKEEKTIKEQSPIRVKAVSYR